MSILQAHPTNSEVMEAGLATVSCTICRVYLSFHLFLCNKIIRLLLDYYYSYYYYSYYYYYYYYYYYIYCLVKISINTLIAVISLSWKLSLVSDNVSLFTRLQNSSNWIMDILQFGYQWRYSCMFPFNRIHVKMQRSFFSDKFIFEYSPGYCEVSVKNLWVLSE